MALTDNGMGYTMNVAPACNYPVNGGWGNGFGEDWLILFLFAMMFGGGWGGMGGYGGFGGAYEFPWLLTGQNQIQTSTADGFRSAQLSDGITSIRDGISGLSTQLCDGFSGVQMGMANGFANTTAAITGAQNALTAQMYNNEIASLNRSFDAQTAIGQNFNNVQSQLAQCCSDNRLASADLKYTIATENCADRAALSDGIRDIVAATQAQTQTILDKMCQDKIDAKNDEIAQLRQEILYARGQASQIAQNQQVIDGIYNRLDSCPIGTTPIYGRQPIFTCNNGFGCGCGA